ncbi:MAG: DEAD/DEAH box helicase [Chloroflexi bacterium]|nr:DEAD/DEAH box helicase [Chloroflexota bacterium]
MSQTFAELGLTPDYVAGLTKLGYERPTKLQSEAIPALLAGRDVVAEAPPGSGKTIAYVVPILQTMDPDIEGVQVLVIAPRKGDVLRIAAAFQDFDAERPLHVVPVFKEQPLSRETERLSKATNIVVGTADRIKEHVERESFSLDELQIVVLDGADQMLSNSLQSSLEAILDQTPGGRQTVLFATALTAELQRFADQFLFEPSLIKREAAPVAMPLIKHRYQAVANGDKQAALMRLLDGEAVTRSLLYVNLATETEAIARTLRALGYYAEALTASTSADERERIVRNWQEQSIEFLVLTDAAAADLMLESDYAICYDVASEAETYAARARLVAENGTQFTLVLPRERALLSEIETFLGLRIKAVLPPTRADLVAQRTEAFKQKLREVIARSNLEIYMSLLNDLAKEGYDWSELAAAAVSLIQHTQTEVIFTRRSDRRLPGAARREAAHRAPDEEREVEAGYVRLIMDAGYDIGVRPKDIVGAIANEANIPGRAVGNIDIRDRFTFVEVQQDYVDRVLTRVPSTRLRGRVVNFRRANM